MISCKDYSEIRKNQLKEEISKLGNKPCLVVIQVDDNPASNTYIKNKRKVCEEVDIELVHEKLESDNYSQGMLEHLIKEYGNKLNVDGIIIQLPIPKKYDLNKLLQCIPKEKDVDGFRKDSCFKPCTPLGIVNWLKYNNFNFLGRTATVINRSNIVGKPLVDMLIDEGMTVTCCNSHTTGISRFMFNAALVVSAIGKPKHFNKFDFRNVDVIVDVGINRDENGKLCGDIDSDGFEQFLPDTYLTPVPNGVGKLTVLQLIENVYQAYLSNMDESEE